MRSGPPDTGAPRRGGCETNKVDYLFGLARNARLVEHIEADLWWAEEEAMASGKAARRFVDFQWTTRESWSRRRRVVAKAEWTQAKANPRFVVTSLAYVPLAALRRIGLKHTQFARATCGTPRLKLLKIGALIRTSVRRVKVAMASGHPYQAEFAHAHARLSAAAA